MIATGRVVNLAPEDFWVLGAAPFTVGVAAAGGDDLTVAVSFSQGSIRVTDTPVLAVDYAGRIPNDLFLSRFAVSPGVCQIGVTVGSAAKETLSDLAIRIFDQPTYFATVTNQSQLQTALYAVRDGSYSHAQITLATNNYSWPGSCDLSSRDVLVTFRGSSGGATFNLSASPPIKWARWINCRFSNPAASAFVAADGSHHQFDRCVFSNSVSGLVCRSSSFVRVDACHVSNVITGIINARIVRGLSWTQISGTVFQNCPVIEGTFGYRNYSAPLATDDLASVYRQTVWAGYDGPQAGLSIRNNLVAFDYSVLMRIDTSAERMLMVGNVMMSSSASPIAIRSLQDSVIASNTIYHTGPGDTLVMSGNTQSNAVVSNYLGKVGASSRRLQETADEWSHNAYDATTALTTSDTATSSPGWQNNYRWLGPSSPLRYSGRSLNGVRYTQGVLSQGQVGALPYHPDASLTHVYKNYRVDAVNGLFLPATVVL